MWSMKTSVHQSLKALFLKEQLTCIRKERAKGWKIKKLTKDDQRERDLRQKLTGKVPNKAQSDKRNRKKEAIYYNIGKVNYRARYLCPSAAKLTQLAELQVGWAAVTTVF